ncbi:MAG: hypothetical protein RI897_2807 [Verrucomicrobiota bacterium]
MEGELEVFEEEAGGECFAVGLGHVIHKEAGGLVSGVAEGGLGLGEEGVELVAEGDLREDEEGSEQAVHGGEDALEGARGQKRIVGGRG